jgi:DNA polymerase V
VTREAEGDAKKEFVQYDLFTDYEELERQEKAEKAALDKERRMQQAVLSIKKRYGKNAILKGSNLSEGATTIERNSQIGGHRK